MDGLPGGKGGSAGGTPARSPCGDNVRSVGQDTRPRAGGSSVGSDGGSRTGGTARTQAQQGRRGSGKHTVLAAAIVATEELTVTDGSGWGEWTKKTTESVDQDTMQREAALV